MREKREGLGRLKRLKCDLINIQDKMKNNGKKNGMMQNIFKNLLLFFFTSSALHVVCKLLVINCI